MSIKGAALERWLDLGTVAANDDHRSDAARLMAAMGVYIDDWQDQVLARFEASPRRFDPWWSRRFGRVLADHVHPDRDA